MVRNRFINDDPDCQHRDACRRSGTDTRFCHECWTLRRRRRRKHISERTLRAATIIAWLELPHEQAKQMTEDEIIGLVEYDHYPVRKADGGEDLHHNLRPLLRDDHKAKTKYDASDMAHERAVRRAVDEHAQRMLLKSTFKKYPSSATYSRWPSRPFPTRRPKK